MKHKLLHADDFFDDEAATLDASYVPWVAGNSQASAQTPPDAVTANQGTAPTAGASLASSVVAVTTGGITFDLLFDSAAMAAPASFRAGIEQAATMLANTISDKITVDIKIDYSGTGGGAAAGPDSGSYKSYSLVHSDLVNGAAPGDTTFNALPSGSSIQGQSNVVVWSAQMKLFGLIGANDTTTDDGSAVFATDISPNLLVGVALHELTHALGRVPYGAAPDIFDLFRYTSPGVHLFQAGNSAPAAYFSLDGGVTKLADFGQYSDPSDFLNSGVQGSNDPFNEYYSGSTSQMLSSVDLTLLHATGYHIGSGRHAQVAFSDPSTSFTIAPDNAGGVTLTRAGNLPVQVDNVEFLKFSDQTLFVENADNANIARLYSAAFNRAPDIGGLSGWEDIYGSNISTAVKAHGLYAALAQTNDGFGTSIAGGFTQSAEFQSKYGSLTDAGFVTQLYLNVLNRTPAASELNAWLGLIHNGDANGTHYTHDMVLVGFAESPENIAKTAADWLIQI